MELLDQFELLRLGVILDHLNLIQLYQIAPPLKDWIIKVGLDQLKQDHSMQVDFILHLDGFGIMLAV